MKQTTAIEKKIPLTPEQFAALSRQERKLLIVTDVLETIERPKSRKPIVCRGQYLETLRFFYMPAGIGRDTQVSSILPAIEANCAVCAMGALLISHIRLFNQLRLEKIGCASYIWAASMAITEALDESFTPSELRVIEAAFEGQVLSIRNVQWSSEELDRINESAAIWHSAFGGDEAEPEQDEERLRTICKNIVRNQGDFVIGQLPV